jgi:hypothetical protein
MRDIDTKIRSYFKTRYRHVFTDAEFLEVKTSLYYFGRAIAQYLNTNKYSPDTKKVVR